MHNGPKKPYKKTTNMRSSEQEALKMLENINQEEFNPGADVNHDLLVELAQLEHFLLHRADEVDDEIHHRIAELRNKLEKKAQEIIALNEQIEFLMTESHIHLTFEDYITPTTEKKEKKKDKQKDKEKQKHGKLKDKEGKHHKKVEHQSWSGMWQQKAEELKVKIAQMIEPQASDSAAMQSKKHSERERRSKEAREKLKEISHRRSERLKQQEEIERTIAEASQEIDDNAKKEITSRVKNYLNSLPKEMRDEATKYLIQKLEDKLTNPLKSLEKTVHSTAKLADFGEDVMGEVTGRAANYIKKGKAEIPLSKRLHQLATKEAPNFAENFANSWLDVEIHQHPQTFKQSVHRVSGALKEGDIKKAYEQTIGFVNVKAMALDETLTELQNAIEYANKHPRQTTCRSLPILPSQATAARSSISPEKRSKSFEEKHTKHIEEREKKTKGRGKKGN